jgi:alkanesulfonate monooxygenase SsuD/methylene tetrahydromethanopterin reductase-like flavin-dependent oxidoreductase (luciferase family)
MKELWTKEEAEFHGRFFDFPPVKCSPKPVQQPHPPVLLGGYAANVFKRVVAWGDGWMPVRVSEEQVRAGRATLDELAEAAGRDPSTIQLIVSNLQPDRDVIARYGEAGANRVTVALPPDAGAQGLAELERLAEQVL